MPNTTGSKKFHHNQCPLAPLCAACLKGTLEGPLLLQLFFLFYFSSPELRPCCLLLMENITSCKVCDFLRLHLLLLPALQDEHENYLLGRISSAVSLPHLPIAKRCAGLAVNLNPISFQRP